MYLCRVYIIKVLCIEAIRDPVNFVSKFMKWRTSHRDKQISCLSGKFSAINKQSYKSLTFSLRRIPLLSIHNQDKYLFEKDVIVMIKVYSIGCLFVCLVYWHIPTHKVYLMPPD